MLITDGTETERQIERTCQMMHEILGLKVQEKTL